MPMLTMSVTSLAASASTSSRMRSCVDSACARAASAKAEPAAGPRSAPCSAARPSGDVDLFTRQQLTQRRGQVRAFRDREQRIQRFAVIPLAREVGVERAAAQGEIAGAGGIGGQQGRQRGAGKPVGLRLQTPQQASHPGQAACLGMEWLVWVSRLSRSTYTQVGLCAAASSASHCT